MKLRDLRIENYDWHVRFYFAVHGYHTRSILFSLEQIECPRPIMERVRENLEKADISLPGTFVCQATGNVQNLHEADRINGSLQWELRLKNSPVFANVMPDSLSKKIHIPPTRFTGNARLSPEMIRSKAQIRPGEGLS